MAAKHIHKLKRHRFKTGNEIYFCMLPDCSYKVKPALTLGKTTLCHRCGEPFTMTEYAIRLTNPHCEPCHVYKKGKPPENTAWVGPPNMEAHAELETAVEVIKRMNQPDSVVDALQAELDNIRVEAEAEKDI